MKQKSCLRLLGRKPWAFSRTALRGDDDAEKHRYQNLWRPSTISGSIHSVLTASNAARSREQSACLTSARGLRMRLHIIGVKVRETNPEIRTATMMVTRIRAAVVPGCRHEKHRNE